MKFHHEKVFTLDAVFTEEECRAQIERIEAIGFEAAPITTPHGFVMAPEVRNNTRVMLDDFALAEELWARVRDPIPSSIRQWRAVGLNERFRFYRYRPGQCFRWHRDGCFRRNEREESFFTLMVYLNQGFTGGATEFEGFAIEPMTGRALVFDHPLRHQGAIVESGVKYVMRTDVMYRRQGR